MDEIVGDAIDQAVSIEMRFASGLPRGVMAPLYRAARERAGQPLCFAAASALKARLKAGDHVFIITGAGAPPTLPKGETDGPPGAAAIARALDIGLNVKPIMLSEERHLSPVVASCEGVGLAVVDEAVFRARGGCAMAIALPLGAEPGAAAADALFERFDPKAVIFVEKLGPNEKGVCYTITGTPRPPEIMASAHLFAEMAMEQGVLTVGVGDGGNEIGCGNIHDVVQAVQPMGKMCRMPGDGGNATVVRCDHLVFASVSNWGAYGIAAALAGLLERPSVLHDVDAETRMLERCIAAGAMDGGYARLIPYVDGTTAAVQTSILTILHQIVSNGLTTANRGF
ncbi:MAG: hypothetical protein BGP06_09330 [Rhizobiales bacterium 65-9]|nr:MAG: hypothetical protein BGP06_09330 [Rhizobiales bacterium 65-9]